MIRWLLAIAIVAFAASAVAAGPEIPGTTRKVVMEKFEGVHRLKLVTAPMPKVGDHQVLVRVRAVALNRGDDEILRSKRSRDYTGVIAASDAAGDVVAVGKRVKDFEVGPRVTSLYFKTGSTAAPARTN